MVSAFSIGGLFLASPVFLAGLLLVALPVIAHLLNRRVRRRLVFPSLRFLKPSAAQRHQLLKLRRYVLLALRTLAVVLIVLAFTRPRWFGGSSAGTRGGDRGAVVVLADVSASLGRQQGGLPAFHHLRAAAARTVRDAARRGDVCNLVLAGARPRAVFGEMTANSDLVERELATLEPLPERADVTGALALAGRLLATHDGPRQLVLLSDLQAANWEEVLRRTGANPWLPPNTEVTVIDMPAATPRNWAISEPALHPAVAVAGQRAQVTVQVSNYSEQAGDCRVELAAAEQTVAHQVAALEPYQHQELAFTYRFPTAGHYRLEFSLPDDSLGTDNRAYLACTVVEQPPVVVVSDGEPDTPGTAAYYLVRALSPHDDRRDQFDVRYLRSYEVNEHQLQDSLAVVMADTAPLSAEALAGLAGFIARGGGVILYAAGSRFTDNALALSQAVEGGCLPWHPQGVRTAPRERPFFFSQADWSASALRAFDPESREIVEHIPLFRCAFGQDPHPEGRILLRFADGSPALGFREHGSGGRCILANFTPERDAGDLGLSGFFVALNHALIEDLQSTARRSVRHIAGQGMTFSSLGPYAAGGPTVMCYGPDGSRLTEADYLPLHEALQVTIPHGALPGFYSLTQGDRTLALAAANLDPRESDLRAAEREPLMAWLAGEGGSEARWVTAGAPGPVLPERYRPLWGWMLAAALLALACEMALLGIWRA